MPTTGQPPIYLTILRKGDLNLIDLAEVGALIPRSETQVDEAFLQELATEVRLLATPGHGRRGDQAGQENLSVREPSPVVYDLQRIGGLIFAHLLTEPARKRLRTAEPCDLYLRLDDQLIQVTCELCYDGQDFLATKFWLCRWGSTGSASTNTTEVR